MERGSCEGEEVSEMINWVTPNSTGAVRLTSLDELPSSPAIREYRTVDIFCQVIRLNEFDAGRFSRAGDDVTVIDHRIGCKCDYCKAQSAETGEKCLR